ncbi:MAG: hypothetical protein H7Z14_09735 [Anaerolineae bacterium]|nr:hypothetical protein [Phycisphaerae bacterium]
MMAQAKQLHRKLAASAGWGAAIATVTSLGVAPPVIAGDRHWNAATGFWSQIANWNPAAVPGPADHAIIDYFGAGSAGNARINTTAIGAVTAVTVLNGGTVTISNQGSLLCGTDFVLGTGSTQGTLNVLTTNPNLTFPGGITIVTDLRLGVSSGVGLVTQDAGTVTVGRNLIIGDSNTAGSIFTGVGTYNLAGTGVLKVPTIKVATSSTTGTLSVSGFAKLNTDSLTIQAGATGPAGHLRQTGGQVNVAGYTTLQSSAFNSGSATYNLSGGTLTTSGFQINDRCVFNFTGGSASVTTLRMANGRVFMSSGGNKFLRVYDLNLFYESVIDVNDNSMIMTDYFQFQSQLRGAIRLGYNSGAWNGKFIASTTAANNPQHNTALGYAAVWDIMPPPTSGGYMFQGQPVNGSDVIVTYTYYGDTDLNGIVDFDDYSRIDSGFNNGGTDWFHGDFDYNGIVDFDDYSLIDLAFNTQSGTLRRAMAYLDGSDRSDVGMDRPAVQLVQRHFHQFGEAYSASFLNAVPEPSVGFLLFATLLFRRRRIS